MKLAIFGATGRTGIHLVEQALNQGHEVKAYTRSPHKVDLAHDCLHIVEGDILDGERVSEAVQGVDAVISVLGPTENKPVYTISQGTEHIINAMQQHGVQRLIISAGAGVGDPKDDPKLINHIINFVLDVTAKHVAEDMRRVVAQVRGSNLDWTIVRVPMLTDDEPTGDVTAAYVGKGMGMRLSRADMASFMLEQVETDKYVQEAPAISS